jgi:hypothetical protein
MKTIYKYPFPIEDTFTLGLPEGAQILKAACQGGQPCIWALVTPGDPLQSEVFHIFGTGHPIHEDLLDRVDFIDTFQQGPFVWHLFQETHS